MNIENIEAFVYVFHLGSFNKAAQALYLTQPSVSARIQALERELEIQLFRRDGKHTTLTEKGIHFFPYAQQILQSYQEARLTLKQNIIMPHELNIGCAISVANYIMPEILPAFRSEFPDVKIKICTGHSNNILEKVLNKEVDFGLVRTVTHPNVENVVFRKDPISLFVPFGHPFLGSKAISIEEVSVQPLIFFDYGSMDWLMIHRLFENLHPNVVIEVDSMVAAKKLILQGMGIGFLPEHCVQNELSNGSLFRVPIASAAKILIKMDLIFLKGHSSPFIDFFKEARNT